MTRLLPICALGILLTGCAPDAGSAGDQGRVVHGYVYHDANHPDGLGLSSPQAQDSANHGTWLWPPAISDKPN